MMVSRAVAEDAHADMDPVAGKTLALIRDVVGLWVELQARLQAHFAAMASEFGLSVLEAKALLQLGRAGSVTMRALADRLQYDPSNLTRVIDRLEQRDAVRRCPDPHDRRVKALQLTPAGAELRDAFYSRISNDAGPLGQLSAAELERLKVGRVRAQAVILGMTPMCSLQTRTPPAPPRRRACPDPGSAGGPRGWTPPGSSS